MTTAYVILSLNLVLCILLALEHVVVGGVITAIWTLSAVGLIGFHRTGKKGFAYTAMAGFLPFLPIGLLAVLSIKQRLDSRYAPSETMTDALPQRVFYFDRSFLNMYLSIGILAIGAEFATQLAIHHPTPAGAMGLILLIMSFALRKHPLLRCYPDRIILKQGPLNSEKVVAFNDIERVESRRKNLLIHYRAVGKPLKIRLGQFNPSERPDIVKMFHGLGDTP